MKYLSSRKEPCCCFWNAPLPSRHSTWAVAKEEAHTARSFRDPLQYQEWPAPKCSVIIGNKQEILSVKHPGINEDIEEIFDSQKSRHRRNTEENLAPKRHGIILYTEALQEPIS
jgi:hypothetical protein